MLDPTLNEKNNHKMKIPVPCLVLACLEILSTI